jgi:hypothetical protein
MEMLDQKSEQELLESLLAEIAKANRELKCAQADIQKAQGRLGFTIMLVNKLINRSGD